MSSLEGRITLILQPGADSDTQVTLQSARPVHASRMFHGKPIEETLQSLPLLFSICSTAQAAAATEACEQAMNITPDPTVAAAREQLVMVETLREHLWRLLLDWSRLLQLSPAEQEMATVMGRLQTLQHAIHGGTPLFQLNPSPLPSASTSLETLTHPFITEIIEPLLGTRVKAWQQITGFEALQQWMTKSDGVLPTLFQQLQQSQWASLGSTTTPLLPMIEKPLWQSLLGEETFIERPQWEGRPHEASPLTRSNSLLLASVTQQWGNGVMARMVARISEIIEILQTLPHPVQTDNDTSLPNQSGIGIVEAARGRLIHHVQLEEEEITRYQIVAPTEWNFHPQGVVVQALQQLPFAVRDLEQQARLIIHAIDPCVGYDLVIQAD